MEKFTVRAFFEDRLGEIVDECRNWCWNKYSGVLNRMYFEIHHSVGALTYFTTVIANGISIHWKEIEYEQQDIPLICPWWKITDLPAKLR